MITIRSWPQAGLRGLMTRTTGLDLDLNTGSIYSGRKHGTGNAANYNRACPTPARHGGRVTAVSGERPCGATDTWCEKSTQRGQRVARDAIGRAGAQLLDYLFGANVGAAARGRPAAPGRTEVVRTPRGSLPWVQSRCRVRSLAAFGWPRRGGWLAGSHTHAANAERGFARSLAQPPSAGQPRSGSAPASGSTERGSSSRVAAGARMVAAGLQPCRARAPP